MSCFLSSDVTRGSDLPTDFFGQKRKDEASNNDGCCHQALARSIASRSSTEMPGCASARNPHVRAMRSRAPIVKRCL